MNGSGMSLSRGVRGGRPVRSSKIMYYSVRCARAARAGESRGADEANYSAQSGSANGMIRDG